MLHIIGQPNGKTHVLQRMRHKLQSDQRMAKLVHGGLSGVLGRGLAIAVSAITLPLTIRYLGREEYGVWITISTSVVMIAVLDLGISSTLTNFIAASHVKDDRTAARAYFASAFWITVAVSIFLGVTLTAVWHLIPWGVILGVQGALASQASRCVAIAIGFFLLNLPLSLANRVLSGYQETQVANYFAMINSVLGLAAIVAAIHARLTLSGMMLTYSCAMLTGTLILNAWLTLRNRPWLRPKITAFSRDKASHLLSQGVMFFLLQVVGLVVFNSDNLVITHYLGAAEVTPYSVCYRLMSYATMLQSLMTPSLWPAFSDAYYRRDLQWLRTTYRRVMHMTLIGVGGAAAILVGTGRWIIGVWATRSAVPALSLLILMAAWSVTLSVTVNQASLLAATQRLRLQAATSSLAACVNLLGTIFLVQRYGSTGVITATLVSYLVCIVLPQSWEVRNILRGRYLTLEHA